MATSNTRTGNSCWVETAADRARFAPLTGRGQRHEVAVVGGGIVGVTAALLLQRAGRSVILLEASRIGEQVTGGSTAKVTSQHGLVYHYLEETGGADVASAYAQSNQAALAWIREQVREKSIDCDLEATAAYAYSTSGRREIEREVDAAARAGLPARLAGDLELPFETAAAVCFEDQAQFHPLKYVAALVQEYVALGGKAYELSRVIDIDSGSPCEIATREGTIRADEVIVATNIPILDRGGFFGRAFPYRHMCIAAPVARDRVPTGMFIGTDEPTRSFRSTAWRGEERLILFIGEAFPTGHADAGAKLLELESFAREHFGIGEPLYRWGNQDYYAADRLPYVGPILPGARHIRVATGFNAWGITTGTSAAHILADDVLGRDNEWAWVYDSRRLGLRAGGRKLVEKNLGVATSWIRERLDRTAEREPATIARGEAAITRIKGRSAAAYRDHEGVLHAFDARCTHLGCHVRWNRAEMSWDCHCHGSRFGTDGRVLNGPATDPLRPVDS